MPKLALSIDKRSPYLSSSLFFVHIETQCAYHLILIIDHGKSLAAQPAIFRKIFQQRAINLPFLFAAISDMMMTIPIHSGKKGRQLSYFRLICIQYHLYTFSLFRISFPSVISHHSANPFWSILPRNDIREPGMQSRNGLPICLESPSHLLHYSSGTCLRFAVILSRNVRPSGNRACVHVRA